LNDTKFLEIFFEVVINFDSDWFLVTNVWHVDAAVKTLSLVEQNVCRVDVNLLLSHLLNTHKQLLSITLSSATLHGAATPASHYRVLPPYKIDIMIPQPLAEVEER